ncbi:MAG: pilus assembly protein [Gammaproteobacteria bacterium]
MNSHWKLFARFVLGTAGAVAILSLAGVVGAAGGPPVAPAPAVTISSVPLLLVQPVEPNLLVGVDDSGSMDFEVLEPTNDGAFWWSENTQSFVGLNQQDHFVGGDTFNFNKVGDFPGNGTYAPWDKYAYLFPLPGVHRRNFSSLDQYGHYFIPPIPAYAWARSPQYNNAYFDPTRKYVPWLNANGSSMGNMNPTAAQDDPWLYKTTTWNLTTCPRMDDNGGTGGFTLQIGMTLPAGTAVDHLNGHNGWQTVPAGGITITNRNGGRQYVDIQYCAATFWIQASSAAAAIAAAGAGYSSYSPAEVIPGGEGPAGEPMWRFEIQSANFSDGSQYTAAIQEFANWFSYYRKRHLGVRAGLGFAFRNVSNIRTAMQFMNASQSGNLTAYDLSKTADRANFYNAFYNDTGSGGTPTWDLLNYFGQQLENNHSLIQYGCQQNFGVIFTDGYANYPYGSGFGNVDDTANANYPTLNHQPGPPFADTVSNTLADVAMHYYLTDLRSDLPALITVDPRCGTPDQTEQMDCINFPHMDFFGITLHQNGLIYGVNQNSTNDPYTYPPTWETAGMYANRSPVGIDDLWHATINAHGAMFKSDSPQQIAQAFQDLLSNIEARNESATTVAVDSTSYQTGETVYQARFDTLSSGWTGDLVAYPVEADGLVDTTDPIWDARDLMQTAYVDDSTGWDTNRLVATWAPASGSSAAGGVPFRWNQLTGAQQTGLETHWDDLTSAQQSAFGDSQATYGQAVLDYLRGDASNTVANDGPFRNRSYLLGDVVDSAPLYVGVPNGVYPGSDYASFATANATRTPVIYVGANDGMLHAFNANTGVEMFSFIPAGVFANVANLSEPSYDGNHQFFVDGSPNAGDVKLSDGNWHTLLADGLNDGGEGIYAMDVTDPSTFTSESAIASKLLWDITSADAGFEHLGLTYSQPQIAQINCDGPTCNSSGNTFVVIFGSGYNNDDGNPYLYVVNAETGALIKTLDLCSYDGSNNDCDNTLANGLSTSLVLSNTANAVADRVYAGDLQGNLWRVDLSDPDPDNWSAAVLFKAQAGGTDQPITVQPVASFAPPTAGGGVMVYFGTGQYLGVPDNTTTGTQSFYGVLDRGSAPTTPLTRANLDVQTLTDTMLDGVAVRTVSGTAVNWNSQRGWYMDLPDSGERVIANPTLYAESVIFTTFTPNSAPCSSGGSSFLMAVNYATGGAFPGPEFDINGDGLLNGDDQVNGQNPVGFSMGPGYAATPRIVKKQQGPFNDLKLITVSSSPVRSVKERGVPPGELSWTEIR